MDLRRLNDERISRHYQARLFIGCILILLLAAPTAMYAFRAIDGLFNRPSDWIPTDMAVRRDFDDFASHFSVTDLVLVSWDGADVEGDQLDQVATLLKPLCSKPIEGRVMEVDETAAAEIASLAEQVPQLPLHSVHSGSEILRRLTASPINLSRDQAIKRLRGSLIGADGSQSGLILSLSEAGLIHRRKVLPLLTEAIAKQVGLTPAEIHLAGGPYDGMVIDEASIQSVQLYSPPSAIVAALLCLICLRSFAMTAAISIVALVGQGLVLSAIHFSGQPMNAVLIVLPPLIFVLTISSGIHLCNYYLDALKEFPEATRAQAAAIAMRAGTMPCILAASTTVIGLGSLLLVRLDPIQTFGGVAIFGLLSTFALLLMVLPGTMLLHAGSRRVTDAQLLGEQHHQARKPRWIRKTLYAYRGLLGHPNQVIWLFLISTAVMSLFITRLNTSVNLPRMFDASHPLRVQYNWFEQKLGPTINVELLLKFDRSQWDRDALERLTVVRDAHIAVARTEPVAGVVSAVTFLPAIPSGRGVSATASRSVIRGQIEDPNSSVGQLDYLSRDEQFEVWRVSFRLPLKLDSDFGPELAKVEGAMSTMLTNVDPALRPVVIFTGGAKIAEEAQAILLHDLFTSFLSAFLIVAVVMMILLKSVVGGLLAMFPNLFPTLILFGYMGLINLPLDIGSVMSASVALGIAVDDTIHLLARFGSRVARGIEIKKAAWGALQQCGLAMLHTTMVCSVSLLMYGFSNFVPTRQFAFLMFGLLSMALIGDLVLLPAMMVSRLGTWLAKPAMADPEAELEHRPGEAQVDRVEAATDVRRLE